MKSIFSLLIFLCLIYACDKASTTSDKNLQAKPTTSESKASSTSDQKAIALAGAVMEAMGGQEKWDELQFVSWNFFKARDLCWDKKNGKVRIDFPKDSSIYLLDMNTMDGKVWRYGQELTHPDSLSKYLSMAKNIWINDSYWLFMPFKLKDPGVSLSYLRQDTTQAGTAAEVLQLTFNKVGKTPENKYEVFIDKKDNLIKQWSFFKDASQDKASAIWPWDNYQKHNGLLLSSERSDDRGPFNVKVYETLPKEVFENLNYNLYKKG